MIKETLTVLEIIMTKLMYQPWENEELPTPKEGDPAAAVVDVEPKGEDD